MIQYLLFSDQNKSQVESCPSNVQETGGLTLTPPSPPTKDYLPEFLSNLGMQTKKQY